MNPQALESLILQKGFTPVWLAGGPGGRALVVPELQGRVMAADLGGTLAGFININDISDPEQNRKFNNYGGLDRFWIGPEAGEYGFYMEDGKPVAGENWRVPRDLNQGPFRVREKGADFIVMERELNLTNARGAEFKIHVERRVESRAAEDGLSITTINTVTNRGASAWTRATGLPFIWCLGQFPVSESAFVLAGFRPGRGMRKIYNDGYFGKIPSDRVSVVRSKNWRANAVSMRADGGKVTKFGLSAARSTGSAVGVDPSRGLLYEVNFDHDPSALYINNLWTASATARFGGDVFQSYNSGDGSFFELESISPALFLTPGESQTHSHSTRVARIGGGGRE